MFYYFIKQNILRFNVEIKKIYRLNSLFFDILITFI
jgi:hypothetical protein